MKRIFLLGAVAVALCLPSSAFASGDEFRINSFSTANPVATDSAPCAGDDNGGIALSASKVMLKGVDLCTFDRGNLANGANSFPLSGYDANLAEALFTDLKTNTAWAMPWAGSCGGDWTTIKALDQTTGVPAGAGDITLSSPISCPTGSNWVIASGYGRVLLLVPGENKIYDVALPSGQVTTISKSMTTGYATAEGVFTTLVAENFDGALWLVYVDSSTQELNRWNLSTNAIEGVEVAPGSVTNLSTLAQMAPDVTNNHMYFHIESWTLLAETAGMGEPLVRTDASFSYGDPGAAPNAAAHGRATKRFLRVRASCPAISGCSVKFTGYKKGTPKATLKAKTVALASGEEKIVSLAYSRALVRAVSKGGKIKVRAQTVGTSSATSFFVRVPR